tara:strand:- start:4905 stop:5039 length:135 start_codon:yes stop_codon:yes gene_type:complete
LFKGGAKVKTMILIANFILEIYFRLDIFFQSKIASAILTKKGYF